MAFNFKGRCVLITGAAKGIGYALSRGLSARGARLVMLDRDADALASVAASLRDISGDILAIAGDVTDMSFVDGLPARIEAEGFLPDCLINNAGIGSMGLFEELTIAEMQKVFAVNYWAPVALMKAFLPLLKRTPGSHIVNVSSILGLIAAPDQSPYVASKFALRGLSEAVMMEFARHHIGVSVVYPGGVATSIAEAAHIAGELNEAYARQQIRRYTEALKTTPEDAAQTIIRGVERGQSRILIGRDARFVDRLQRFMPARYVRLVARKMSAEPRDGNRGL
jgi:short-subunit dehydrogenase